MDLAQTPSAMKCKGNTKAFVRKQDNFLTANWFIIKLLKSKAQKSHK